MKTFMFAAHTRDGQILTGIYQVRNGDAHKILMRNLQAANIEVVNTTVAEVVDKKFQVLTAFSEQEVFMNTCRRAGLIMAKESNVGNVEYVVSEVDAYPSVDRTTKSMLNGQAISIGSGHGPPGGFAIFYFSLEGKLMTHGIF